LPAFFDRFHWNRLRRFQARTALEGRVPKNWFQAGLRLVGLAAAADLFLFLILHSANLYFGRTLWPWPYLDVALDLYGSLHWPLDVKPNWFQLPAFLAATCVWTGLVLWLKGPPPPLRLPLDLTLARKLKDWQAGGAGFPIPLLPPTEFEKWSFERALSGLEDALKKPSSSLDGLIRSRALALPFLSGFSRDARLWAAVGAGTLAVELGGTLEPEADVLAFGRRCLEKARELSPTDPKILAALLAWQAVEDEEALAVADALDGMAWKGPEPALWRLEQRPHNAELLQAVQSQHYRYAPRALILQARLHMELGEPEKAIKAWQELMSGFPGNRRWWREALAAAPVLGGGPLLEAWQKKLQEAGPERPAPALWQFISERPALVPLRLKRARWTAAALLLMGLVWRAAAVTPSPAARAVVWQGRWNRVALVLPDGTRLKMNSTRKLEGLEKLRPYFETAAFTLLNESEGNYAELRWGKDLYTGTWQKNRWGMELHLEDGGLRPRLKAAEDGLEMQVEGTPVKLLFQRDTPVNWHGSWDCVAVILPNGDRVTQRIPLVYYGKTQEETDDYARLRPFLDFAAFTLSESSSDEYYAPDYAELRWGDPLYVGTWIGDPWGVKLLLEGTDLEPRLKAVEDGLEMRVKSSAFKVLFQRSRD
jgi:hypothetical protein